MKNTAWMIALLVSILSSCNTKDACEDVNCNNGTCDSGDCVCETGYEGFNCEIEQRLAFIGDYNVSESCDLGNFSYTITISASAENGAELTINNIGDFDFDVSAMVDGSTFTISDQSGNGATINGTGTLASGELTITYVMTTSGGQTLSCVMSCTPQ